MIDTCQERDAEGEFCIMIANHQPPHRYSDVTHMKMVSIAKRRHRFQFARAKKLGITPTNYIDVLDLFSDAYYQTGFLCCYCARPMTDGGDLEISTASLDHATPISSGGTNHKDNIRASCFGCNSAKGIRSEAEWIAIVKHWSSDPIRLARFNARLAELIQTNKKPYCNRCRKSIIAGEKTLTCESGHLLHADDSCSKITQWCEDCGRAYLKHTSTIETRRGATSAP
jgi:5-methylcytosine-specific restriction endonuclease McrA